MAALDFPAAEYTITFNDGSTSTVTVDPDENPDEVVAEYLEDRGVDIDTVATVELTRSFGHEEEKR